MDIIPLLNAWKLILPGRAFPATTVIGTLQACRAPAMDEPRRTRAFILCLSCGAPLIRSAQVFAGGGAERRLAVRRLPMEETLIAEYARQLMEAHGDHAIAEAAQRAVDCERKKDKEEAQTWRHVEEALKTMRGPSVS
jgi:hypothetical protein